MVFLRLFPETVMCETARPARGGPDAKKEINRRLHIWSEYEFI